MCNICVKLLSLREKDIDLINGDFKFTIGDEIYYFIDTVEIIRVASSHNAGNPAYSRGQEVTVIPGVN